MIKWLKKPKHTEITLKRVFSAYPSCLKHDVQIVLDILPVAKHEVHDSNIEVQISGGELVTLPSRVYFSIPSEKSMAHLSEIQNDILASLFTRHHDGYVRERYLRTLIEKQRTWLVPYVLQLIGEYVIEIIEYLSENSDFLKTELVAEFVSINPKYSYILSQKVLSYWSCYFCWDNHIFTNHCGYRLLKELDIWDKKIARKRIKRANQ